MSDGLQRFPGGTHSSSRETRAGPRLAPTDPVSGLSGQTIQRSWAEMKVALDIARENDNKISITRKVEAVVI